ncbi:phosphatidylcholine:ceramide cholinephosphotransferase 2 isoform X2 [Equus przewalskii]|uniref:Sphingomyelin synthase 2 n=2 Tax=Equus TaxID=9789 RepID=F6XWQ3_HORSE|nr:phosphatidylcholine:ceramide cholinephosphotransferase 2 [Equus caballus]XP_008511034.1 PREDICTED: phosphatidylcholine:ceramide cholinephosphotransferase 2 isoform X1 [Equus przewalskii]XP_008511035.1 PREDICTED: phosphatidylcholine:ceramide cholinephosphotransferase 2 isoform X1 [Equus przewalskii]XP_008511036.1 PREDICTED: phosphatidylcholine:ceramide cholinephosphotransferase 2 isoform X1 [Equus przewalskii]XP_008511037.1 PREDICTED: phosphatidylcholine:ceramide cholinephosphotransferase 2 i
MDIIETAKLEEHIENQTNDPANTYTRPAEPAEEENKNGNSKPKSLSNGLRKGAKKYPDYIQIAMPTDSRSKYPLEWWKTGIAFVYALFNLVLTTVMITVVHERVPPKELSPPLPDKFFDYIDRVKWAFSVSEINGIILVGLWITQWLFLRYKSIVGRRFFFIIGTLYLYRCVTMYVTTLPVPGMHFQCAPKLNGDSQAKVQRILRLISGGGLSITGSHILCGDFLFSGHTVVLTLTYLFIKEYSPRHFWWYHLICWLLSAAGIICILVAHEHYTVDVIVAYYVTTRLFWWYHSMANEKSSIQCHLFWEAFPNCCSLPLVPKWNDSSPSLSFPGLGVRPWCNRNLKVSSQTNFLSRAWWFPIFYFFEKNVQGSIPCCFSWPLSWPPGCFKSSCKKYSRVQKIGEDNEKST